jgi:outer membrane receptor for Fe3+-dicitrate
MLCFFICFMCEAGVLVCVPGMKFEAIELMNEGWEKCQSLKIMDIHTP